MRNASKAYRDSSFIYVPSVTDDGAQKIKELGQIVYETMFLIAINPPLQETRSAQTQGFL